ncbi:hypothetical protein L596_013933 [Steinernema carpocapsae]|uniref:Protein kinase domain-containing protein n=1 Tax=Steinernema carpocapsae TaxID=34508 RepID=A0A4U5P327_STECR|nr:hypothetical protein L596_013933 [Steinernema carpocapsae]
MCSSSSSDYDLNPKESEMSLEVIQALKNNEIDLQSGLIGHGSFSKVRVGYSKKYGRNVAVKQIDKRVRNDYVKRFLPRELNIVKRLDHDNVVRVFEVMDFGSVVCMIEEFAENGDLLNRVKKLKRIDEVEGRFLFRQLVEGLQYLESIEVVHRDLKCENLFLDCYDNLKIGDFGFARFMYRGESSDTFCGSKAYVAHEILKSKDYSGNGVDIWSAGVILYVMLTGSMPFDDRKPKQMMVNQAQQKIRFSRSSPISQAAKDLILDMLCPDVTKRATLKSILASKWLDHTRYMIRGWIENAEEDSCSTASAISDY